MSVDLASQGASVAAPPASAHAHPNQFALLKQRRFAPFFWTQFSGAANDNLFKFAFTVMVTYQLSVSWLPPALAGLVIGALFILPFLLFSATSGQFTDKFEKTRIIRFVKNLEVVIMLIAAVGFLSGNVSVQVPVLLGCTIPPQTRSMTHGIAPRTENTMKRQSGIRAIPAGTEMNVRTIGSIREKKTVTSPQRLK